MSTKKPLRILIACVVLTACANNAPRSLTPSLAQTKTLIPTIQCGEDEPNEVLPVYPDAPSTETKETLEAYSDQQSAWAITASGALRREKAKRAATGQCLRDLRERGLIN